MSDKINMSAEVAIIGNKPSPTIGIELIPTTRGCFSGVGKFEMDGRKFFVKVVLMPENIGKVFEIKKE